jgi:hypothetical protein
MNTVEILINTVTLPMVLPDEVFELMGKPRRFPDIDLIINQLPAELHALLDLEATVLQSGRSGQNTFLLTLMDSSYLRIRIKNRSIVELSQTHLRGSSVRPI